MREASDILVRHANSTRYEQVRTPARQQIRELPAVRAARARRRSGRTPSRPGCACSPTSWRSWSATATRIVDRLRGLVESALATLRSAQRLSRLPEGLGEWSGQEFLRIRFEEPDQATLTERLGEVIDEATRAAVKKNSDLRRDGMSLLLRGVAGGAPAQGHRRGDPQAGRGAARRAGPVGQMGDVFSGGQLLTAAIALYCTMAALRSNDRGRDKHRHAGTLFLDNPIGRANATYLLELQRAVSDALGVQLLYTTGLFDTTALAEFPLVIRLRNDADLRAGLKYISVEEHLRPGLPQQAPDGRDRARRDHGDPDVQAERADTRRCGRAADPGDARGATLRGAARAGPRDPACPGTVSADLQGPGPLGRGPARPWVCSARWPVRSRTRSATRPARPRPGGQRPPGPRPDGRPRSRGTPERRWSGPGEPGPRPGGVSGCPPRLCPGRTARRRRSRRSRRAVLLGTDTTPFRWFHTCRVTHTSSTDQVATTVLATPLSTIGKASHDPASVHRKATTA